MVPNETIGTAKLKDPIEASAAWSETGSLCNDEDGCQVRLAGGDHGGDCIDLRVDVVTAEAVLDVASDERGSRTGDQGRADGRVSDEKSILPNFPG